MGLIVGGHGILSLEIKDHDFSIRRRLVVGLSLVVRELALFSRQGPLQVFRLSLLGFGLVDNDFTTDKEFLEHVYALLVDFRNGLIVVGVELVVFALGDRIELVIVALGTFHGESQPNRTRGGDAIVQDVGAEFFHLRSSGEIDGNIAVESRCHKLAGRGIGKQVARQLFDGELVKRHVVVQGANDPVAIRPHRPQVIVLITIGIRISGQIEPAGGPLFAEMLGLQQAVDMGFKKFSRRIPLEGGHLLDRGRQADEIQIQASQQDSRLRFWRRFETRLFDPLQNEEIEFAGGP